MQNRDNSIEETVGALPDAPAADTFEPLADVAFDAHPWWFQGRATEAQRAVQAAFVAALSQRPAVSIGDGGFVSPNAHIHATSLTLGSGCLVAGGVRLDGDVVAGDHCSLNLNCSVAGTIRMGDDVRIAAGAAVFGFNHVTDRVDRPIRLQGVRTIGITIGDDVWIGANAVVLDGISIGSHVVIGAGAVVTRDVPDYAIVGGNPARVLRDRREPQTSGASDKGSAKLTDRLRTFGAMAAGTWPAVLEAARTDARPGRAYSDPRNDVKAPLRPDCDAIQIAAMFGAVPPPLTREAWIGRLRADQDRATGLCFHPDTPNADKTSPGNPDGDVLYNILSVGYALECLDSSFAAPIEWARAFDAGTIQDWAAAGPWERNGWGAGARVDALGTALYMNARHFGDSGELAALMGWLLTRANPITGMWSPPRGTDNLLPVNGFYRLTRGTFAQFGLPLPYPERSIDTVLAHARANDGFRQRGFTACNVLDIVHPLWLCARQTSYRSSEVASQMSAVIDLVIDHWVPGRGFAFDRTEEPGLQGTEMWLSVLALAADHLGVGEALPFRLCGVHRAEPALPVDQMNWRAD